jgi:hypothetical protein
MRVAFTLSRSCTFAQACSIGFNSGEYRGRYISPIEQVPRFRGMIWAQVVHDQTRIRPHLLEFGHQNLFKIA